MGACRSKVPNVIERTTETSASVPDGQTLMLVAMTPEAADIHPDKPKGQTFIFIKPNILLPRETSKPSFPILTTPKQ